MFRGTMLPPSSGASKFLQDVGVLSKITGRHNSEDFDTFRSHLEDQSPRHLRCLSSANREIDG
jgi:hypothetical protein